MQRNAATDTPHIWDLKHCPVDGMLEFHSYRNRSQAHKTTSGVEGVPSDAYQLRLQLLRR